MTAATATRKPRTKPASNSKTTSETDDELLARTFRFDDGKFEALRAKGADDDDVLVAVRERWRMAPVAGSRPYFVACDDPRWGTAIWFDTVKPGDEEPSLHYRRSKTGGAREGYLVEAVRRVLSIPGVNGAVAPVKASDVRKVRAEIKRDKAKPLAEDPLATVEVIDQGEYPFTFFKRTALNPRTSFDEELIAEMAPTIESICRMSPILCLEDGTIVDGETRHRAGERAGAKKLFGKKLKCTPEQAAIIRLQTTVKRRDLNPMDRAVAMQSLQTEHGLSVDDVAKIVGMQRGDSVRNIVRLLELPKEWQDKVRSGELTAAAARELVPWKDEPAVLSEVEKQLKKTEPERRSVALPDYLDEAVQDCSRPLSGYEQVGNRYQQVKLKPNPQQKIDLRIRNLKRRHSWESKEDLERAFNLDLWKELAEAYVKTKADQESGRLDSPSGAAEAVKKKENAKKQAQQLQKRLYRFRIAWLQAKCVAMLDHASESTLIAILLFLCTRSEGHYERASAINGQKNRHILGTVLGTESAVQLQRIRDLCKQQLAGAFDSYRNVFDPDDIETLAKYLKIDMKRDWSASFHGPWQSLWVDFQGLWTKDQMIELLAEWRINIGSATKRAELAELFNVEKPCPKMLLEVKPCSLH